MSFIPSLFLILCIGLSLTGCDGLFGSKSDPSTDEIFREGRIDPNTLQDVGYVPLNPFFTQGALGPLESPRDVYIGYDEFIYVIDQQGLHVLDLAGRPTSHLPITDATTVIQDRRLNLYITAKRDTVLDGTTWNLPVIYRYSGISTGSPSLEDIIWHPFDDDSRKFSRPDPLATDEEVAFTGVGAMHDNRIYASRRGPVNLRNSPILPHNAIMVFSPDGINTQTITALNPIQPGLRSSINPASVMTYFHPPQRTTFRQNDNFILAQNPNPGQPIQFAVLGIRTVETPDGIIYRSDTDLVRAAGNPDRGDGFLYEEFKFDRPVDLGFAADGTNYIFVLDAGKDSLFVFTGGGIEGVAPPPGASQIKPVVVSFGGTGNGPLNFDQPSGVAYFREIIYIADTGNNRISRFRLNTDFE